MEKSKSPGKKQAHLNLDLNRQPAGIGDDYFLNNRSHVLEQVLAEGPRATEMMIPNSSFRNYITKQKITFGQQPPIVATSVEVRLDSSKRELDGHKFSSAKSLEMIIPKISGKPKPSKSWKIRRGYGFGEQKEISKVLVEGSNPLVGERVSLNVRSPVERASVSEKTPILHSKPSSSSRKSSTGSFNKTTVQTSMISALVNKQQKQNKRYSDHSSEKVRNIKSKLSKSVDFLNANPADNQVHPHSVYLDVDDKRLLRLSRTPSPQRQTLAMLQQIQHHASKFPQPAMRTYHTKKIEMKPPVFEVIGGSQMFYEKKMREHRALTAMRKKLLFSTEYAEAPPPSSEPTPLFSEEYSVDSKKTSTINTPRTQSVLEDIVPKVKQLWTRPPSSKSSKSGITGAEPINGVEVMTKEDKDIDNNYLVPVPVRQNQTPSPSEIIPYTDIHIMKNKRITDSARKIVMEAVQEQRRLQNEAELNRRIKPKLRPNRRQSLDDYLRLELYRMSKSSTPLHAMQPAHHSSGLVTPPNFFIPPTPVSVYGTEFE